MKRKFFVLITIGMMTSGCFSEKDASDVILLVEPSAREAVSGETIYYDVRSWTENDCLSTFSFTTFDKVNGEQTVMAEDVRASRYEDRIIYDVPEIEADSLVMEMRFSISDNTGYVQTSTHQLKVMAAEIPLSEQTGVTIYSPASGKPDGFVVASRTVVSVAAATQGTVDIYMYQSSDSGDEMLAEWRSQTGLLFTRVTGVDYSTLTYGSMKSLYASALKNVNVPDIRTDDLIIVGTETGPLLAIKVMGVYDEYGTENDRCVLNIKYPVL